MQVFVPGEATGGDEREPLPDESDVEPWIDLQEANRVMPVPRPPLPPSMQESRRENLVVREVPLELKDRFGCV